MTPKLEEWTLVLLGQWNVRVFTPAWVATNLFNVANVQVELTVAPGQQSLRLRGPHVALVPLDDRLIIGCNAADIPSLEAAEQVALNVFRLLTHTPVAAFGFNLGFTEPDPPVELSRLFELNDRGALAEFNAHVASTTLARKLTLDAGALNLQ